MNYDALIDFIADKLNEKINLPFLNEAQEKRLITFVLSLAFEFLLKFLFGIFQFLVFFLGYTGGQKQTCH